MTNDTPYLILIYTRFAGATATQGSRVVATSTYFGKKSKTAHNYLHEYSGEENHKTAAFKFLGQHYGDADRHNLELIGKGENPSGYGYTWVFKRVGV